VSNSHFFVFREVAKKKLELQKVCGELEAEMRVFDATRVKIEEEKNEVINALYFEASF